ncbi:hypothetical protein [Clostridium oceanicum]|uniref:Uncharacterized protein n=1 Tax=Clostridium oceanicum TaxID=1543 RepID=A0ABP3USY4_9CLOT
MAIPQKSSNYTDHPSKKIYDKEKIKTSKPKEEENNSFEVIEKNSGKEKFSLITFEGGKDFCNIPNIKTNITTVKFPNWISLIQKNKEQSSNKENIPSSNTIASWIKCEGEQDNIRNILFEYPVCSVSLHYSSYFPIKICAYDSNNKLLATIEGSKNWSNESGYSQFNELTLRQNNDTIKKLKIENFAEYIAIDNLKISRISEIPSEKFQVIDNNEYTAKNNDENSPLNTFENLDENKNNQENDIPKEDTDSNNTSKDSLNSNETTNSNNSEEKKDKDSSKETKSNQNKTFDKLFIALSLYLLFFHNSNTNMNPMRGPMMPPNMNPNFNPNNPNINPNMPPNRY